MASITRRYFIELQPAAGPSAPRWRETELRREQALRFIMATDLWLKQTSLHNKVSGMNVTALGQIQMICEADVINQLRDYDDMSIAVIRPGTDLSNHQASFIMRGVDYPVGTSRS